MFSIPWQSPKRGNSWRRRLTANIASRAQRWARKRQGSDHRRVTLLANRTYILPTGLGFVFALVTFAILLGAMNYNNNMAFVLTFTLVGLGLVSMHQCQRNLVGLELQFAGAEPVFAGQSAIFRVVVRNPSKSSRHQLQLYCGELRSDTCDLAPGESRVLTLALPTRKRGYVHLERFGVRTTFPFEIFRAWAWLHMDLRALVYPHPASHAPPPPPSIASQGHRQHDERGEEDFAGLRKFNAGDPPKHIAWKAYARSGELLSKQFAGADTSSQWFDVNDAAAADIEARLSIVVRWILEADRKRSDYGLRTGGQEFPPAHGEKHQHECLKALALFGDGQDHA